MYIQLTNIKKKKRGNMFFFFVCLSHLQFKSFFNFFYFIVVWNITCQYFKDIIILGVLHGLLSE